MSDSPFNLSGKLALITGGGTGLGFGISKAYLKAGAKVVITGRRESVLKEAVEKLGPNASYMVNDVSKLSSLPGFVDQFEKMFGPVDILVNNAGINLKKHLTEVSDEEFLNIIQTNVNGLFALTREVAKKMIPRKQGVVINITSMAALYGIPNVTAYT